MSKLKPCPFCGGQAVMERLGDHHQSCIVACEDCGARLETNEEAQFCGMAWDRRFAASSPDTIGPEVRMFREWLDRIVTAFSDDFQYIDYPVVSTIFDEYKAWCSGNDDEYYLHLMDILAMHFQRDDLPMRELYAQEREEIAKRRAEVEARMGGQG